MTPKQMDVVTIYYPSLKESLDVHGSCLEILINEYVTIFSEFLFSTQRVNIGYLMGRIS